MQPIQEQAHEKMLVEMATEHTDTEDKIHNWLCQQVNEDLWSGILKEAKTIKKAVAYCGRQARAISSDNQTAMVASDTVFQWVMEYFTVYEEPKPKAKATTSKKPRNPKEDTPLTKKTPVNTVTKKEEVSQETQLNEWEGEQLDMFAEFDF